MICAQRDILRTMSQQTPHSRDTDPGKEHWKINIDTGGTFTDGYAVSPDGGSHRTKVLSSGHIRAQVSSRGHTHTLLSGLSPEILEGADVLDINSRKRIGIAELHGSTLHLKKDPRYSELLPSIVDLDPGIDAPLLAMHDLTKTPLSHALPSIQLRVATTRGTNALLTNDVARVLLVTTTGFGDLPIIGDQSRPDIFEINPTPPHLLPAKTIEIDARMSAEGKELNPLHIQPVQEAILELFKDDQIDSVAIALLHSWKNPAHEAALSESLLSVGIPQIVCSYQCSPDARLVPRMRTTIAEAALAPTITSFLSGLGADKDSDEIHAMSSSGGLVIDSAYRASQSLLSGPAAGIVGAAKSARQCTDKPIIGFDMGGTSTDVCRHDQHHDLRDETYVANACVRVPSVDLHTVAAGGGSLCRVEAGRLHVGPESAGAIPGPACYGAGGPLTITDVNLLQGRIDQDTFGVPISLEAAEQALHTVMESSGKDRAELLDGFRALAEESMAEAIRTVTTRRGEHPESHVLVAFGGAGGQHACGIADRLGIQQIIIPAETGLLSAVGLHTARRECSIELPMIIPLEADSLAIAVRTMELRILQRCEEEGIESPTIFRRQFRCRLEHQDTTIDIECRHADESLDSSTLARRFNEEFEKVYGYQPPDRQIELASIRYFAGDQEHRNFPAHSPSSQTTPTQSHRRIMRCDQSDRDTTVLSRASITNDVLQGPLLVIEETSTVIVDPKWTICAHPSGALIMKNVSPHTAPAISDAAASEIVACRLESIARDMGETLRRTALSVNVRERLDYSCGILDTHGQLVVNAPHMPVHLGALGTCVRMVTHALPLGPNDVALVNHPGFGGSHLPDLTVITPVYVDEECIGYVANRAHHAEIGGTRPGSMPPDATRLYQEGVVIKPIKIIDAGRTRFDRIEELLRNARYPSRMISDNMADLQAQVAANQCGAQRLHTLRKTAGKLRFDQDVFNIRNRCKNAVHQYALRNDGCDRSVIEYLDDGSPICLRYRSTNGKLTFDFTGSSPVHSGNLNAPESVTRAAVLYAIRIACKEDIPLNEGALEDVTITIPSGMLAPDFSGDEHDHPAVAIGNTETSQRVVDTILRALGCSACSQGTMNNTLIGNDSFAYYETVCGGAGAISNAHGCDAIHTHMTNTRITDPEILELRIPVRIEHFKIRRHSGGAGHFRGGNGVIRTLRALSPLQLSFLSQHRVEKPYGVNGGESGTPGIQRIIRTNGEVEDMPGIFQTQLEPGDALHLETPGGGGWGDAELSHHDGLPASKSG